MYQTSETKRWNVTVHQDNNRLQTKITFKGVRILAVGSNFVAIEESNGKEYIFTGGQTNISIEEV